MIPTRSDKQQNANLGNQEIAAWMEVIWSCSTTQCRNCCSAKSSGKDLLGTFALKPVKYIFYYTMRSLGWHMNARARARTRICSQENPRVLLYKYNQFFIFIIKTAFSCLKHVNEARISAHNTMQLFV